jgi:hypothetical protein
MSGAGRRCRLARTAVGGRIDEGGAPVMLAGLPDPAFTRKFIFIGASMWLLFRAALIFAAAAGESILVVPSLSLGLPASVSLIAMCGAIVVVDVLRRHERIFLANLGVSLRPVALIGAIPALLGEAMTTAVATLMGL